MVRMGTTDQEVEVVVLGVVMVVVRVEVVAVGVAVEQGELGAAGEAYSFRLLQ